MVMKRLFSSCCSMLLLVLVCNAQSSTGVVDHLNIRTISFEKKLYKLDWSSHPSVQLYKQEYLPAGEITGKYKSMILLDVIVTGKTARETAAEKIMEIKQQQAVNPLVNYQVYDNKSSNEYMIDFVLTASSPDGNSVIIAERNVYRYKSFTDAAGKKAILLFGVSNRAYGNSTSVFLASLKSTRSQLVNQVAKQEIPVIKSLQ